MIRRYIRTITPQVIIDLYRARHEAEKAADRIPEDEKQYVRDRCPPGCAALDIGANVGGYTLLLRDAADELHAFEPLPFMARRLRCAFPCDDKVQIHRVALSDRAGQAVLRLPVHRGQPMTGLASLVNDRDLADLPARTFRVRLQRLDERRFARRVGFVKIDVEGYELAVLEGAVQTLQAHRPAILVEIDAANMRPVVELLRQFGYCGSFGFAGEYLPVEAFDEARHQPAAALNVLRQSTGVAPYVSNFLFTADARC